ncbi:MAG: ankyrin repeat domain-containing protein [Verrucomicrobia bacterium]|nr:ankyrin repeat domain-containing protein [Verrucomicrobiota bacterium]
MADRQAQARRFGRNAAGVPDRTILCAAAGATQDLLSWLETGAPGETLSSEEKQAQAKAARLVWSREVLGVNRLARQLATKPAWLEEANAAWTRQLNSSDPVIAREQLQLLWPELKSAIGTVLRGGGPAPTGGRQNDALTRHILGTYKQFGQIEAAERMLDEAWNAAPLVSKARTRITGESSPPRDGPWQAAPSPARPANPAIPGASAAEEPPQLDAFLRPMEPWPLVTYQPGQNGVPLEKKLNREITGLAVHRGALWIAEATQQPLPRQVGQNPQGSTYLWRYDPVSRQTKFATTQLAKHSTVRGLVPAGDDLWLGFDADGVWRWTGGAGEIRRFTGEDGLVTPRMLAGQGTKDAVFFLGGTPPNFVIGQYDLASGKWSAITTPPVSSGMASMAQMMGGQPPALPALAVFGEWLGISTPTTTFYNRTTREWVNLLAVGAGAQLRPGMAQPVMMSSMISADEKGFWLGGPNLLIFLDPAAPKERRVVAKPPGAPVAAVHQGRWLWLLVDEMLRTSSLVLFDKQTEKIVGRTVLPVRGMNKLAANGTHVWVGGSQLVEVVVHGVDGLEAAAATVSATTPADSASGWTPLHAAVENGDLATVRELLARGEKPNTLSHAGEFPLLLAVAQDDLDKTKALLDAGADANLQPPPTVVLRKQTDAGLPRWDRIRHLDATAPPAQPTDLKVELDTAGNVVLSWQDRADNESLYQVGRGQVRADFVTALDFYLPANTTRWTDPIAHAAREQLTYQVIAVNGANAGPREVDQATEVRLTPTEASTPAKPPAGQVSYEDLIGRGLAVPPLSGQPTALHAAVERGNLALAGLLLQRGADVHRPDATGATPLLLAARGGNPAMVQLLLQHKARADVPDQLGRSPARELFIQRKDETLFRTVIGTLEPAAREREADALILSAAAGGSTYDLELLISLGGDLAASNTVGESALSEAIRARRPAILAWLLEKKIPLKKKVWTSTGLGRLEEHALATAVESGEMEMLGQLLAAGADINALVERRPLLAIAAKANDAAMVEWLLQHGADRKAVLRGGQAPPDLTTDANVRALLEARAARWTMPGSWRILTAGPPATRRDAPSQQPEADAGLFAACKANDLAAATRALAAGAALDAVDRDGKSPLMIALRAGAARVVEWLLEAGAPVHQTDRQGWSPLGYAVQSGKAAAVKTLLLAGADPNFNRDQAATPLVQAAEIGSVEIVRLLLEAGAAVNLLSSGDPMRGISPLGAALRRGDAALVELFLAQGADPRAQDFLFVQSETKALERFGAPSLLMQAAAGGDVALIKMMIGLGQDPRFRAFEDYDALAWAATQGRRAAVEFLLTVSAQSPHALEEATNHGHPEIVALLRKAGYK